MANIKDLIEQLKDAASHHPGWRLFEAADLLERLTQPVGVDAIGWLTEDGRVTLDVAAPIKFGEHWRVPIYSAETVARLQEQVKILREALITGSRYICGEGSQEEILEMEYVLRDTEPKEISDERP